VAAADYFVLPSLLEACPTVALEALASGTPVVSADHPGGVELHQRFGDDVTIVPREDAGSLARALAVALEHKRRTRPATAGIIDGEFRTEAVARRFREVYAAAREPAVPEALRARR
jgi:glycosyltransferase involved in cell wall biosynthesis